VNALGNNVKRTNLNFAVDAFAFAAFLALMSTGVLLSYVLPPGSGGFEGFGEGHGAERRPILLLWGLTRHEWGSIHFWIAVGLVAILAIHLALHWKWITCVVRGNRSDDSGIRFGLGLAATIALVALIAMPLVAPVTQQTRGQLKHTDASQQPLATIGRDQIRGSTTISEAARLTGLTVPELINRLKLPDDVSSSDAVGPALRHNGMRMSDLRQLLDNKFLQSKGTQVGSKGATIEQ
jgi:hypothetical protein